MLPIWTEKPLSCRGLPVSKQCVARSTTQSGFKKHRDGRLDEIKLVRSLLITTMNYPSTEAQAVYGF